MLIEEGMPDFTQLPELALTLYPEWAWAVVTIGRVSKKACKDLDQRWGGHDPQRDGPRTCVLWPACECGRSWGADLVPKDIENRGWAFGTWAGRTLLGTKIAIHAGRHVGGRAGRVAREEGLEAVHGMFLRANPGRNMPSDWIAQIDAFPRCALVGVATLASIDREERTGWDVPGSWHWRLADVAQLPKAIHMRGSMGLWPVCPTELSA